MYAEISVRPLMAELTKAAVTQNDEFEASIPVFTFDVLKEFAEYKGIEFNQALVKRYFGSRHSFCEVDRRVRGKNENDEYLYFAKAHELKRKYDLPFGAVESYQLKWKTAEKAVLSAFGSLKSVNLRESLRVGSQYSISFNCLVGNLVLVFDVYGSLGKAKRIYFNFNVLSQSGEILSTIPLDEIFGDMRDPMTNCEAEAREWAEIYSDRCDRVARFCQRVWPPKMG